MRHLKLNKAVHVKLIESSKSMCNTIYFPMSKFKNRTRKLFQRHDNKPYMQQFYEVQTVNEIINMSNIQTTLFIRSVSLSSWCEVWVRFCRPVRLGAYCLGTMTVGWFFFFFHWPKLVLFGSKKNIFVFLLLEKMLYSFSLSMINLIIICVWE